MSIKEKRTIEEDGMVIYYLWKFFEARNTLALNKEFIVVMAILLASVFLSEPFLGYKSVLVPFGLLLIVPLIDYFYRYVWKKSNGRDRKK
jgi:hypothetical protein